nr:hypothetical protein [Shinella sumterensis]
MLTEFARSSCISSSASGLRRRSASWVTTTPLGAIARIEHALDGFEGERERYRQRLAVGRRRLASYQARDGEAEFAFAGELAEKRKLLAVVEEALAADIERPDDALQIAS